MSGTEGFKVWVFSLISYDKYGNGTLERSFVKPAEDSKIKFGKKKKQGQIKQDDFGEQTLF